MFIMVIGGTASGKNWWFDKNLKGLPLIDIDQYILKMANNDPNADRSKLVSPAVKQAKETMTTSFEKGTTVVQTSTGGNYKGTANKFKLAKSHGMKTVLILISVSGEIAIKRNQIRVKKGGHGSTIPDQKIINSNRFARETFDKLRKTNLVDFSEKIDS